MKALNKKNINEVKSFLDEYKQKGFFHRFAERRDIYRNLPFLRYDNLGYDDTCYLDGKRAWNYVPTKESSMIDIISLLIKLDITSFIDLGCGAGILLQILHDVHNTYPSMFNFKKLRLNGIELERKWINKSKLLLSTNFVNKQNWDFQNKKIIKKGDITKIRKQSIKDFECIYVYEPLIDKENCKKFADNIFSIMSNKQILVLNPHYNMEKYLDEIFGEHLNIGGLFIYQKK